MSNGVNYKLLISVFVGVNGVIILTSKINKQNSLAIKNQILSFSLNYVGRKSLCLGNFTHGNISTCINEIYLI